MKIDITYWPLLILLRNLLFVHSYYTGIFISFGFYFDYYIKLEI